MNVKSVEKKEHSAVELVIEVGREEFDAAIEKVYRKQRGGIMISGFRKGKAPRKVIEAMYGASVFFEDAIDDLYPTAYTQAVEQEGLDTASYPKVEILDVSREGFSFKATVTVRPEGKVKDYRGLIAPKAEVTVTEEDLENELKPLVEQASRLVAAARAAKEGDTAVIDFEGFLEGVPFEGGKGEMHELELGSGSFIPGFEEQVVGLSAGDERDVNVTFPAEYQAEELAGKPVVFKVKVHEVKEKQRPVLDDEFAKDVSAFDTLDELKKDLGDKLAERRAQEADRAFESALMEQLIERLEVEVPEAMVDHQAERMVEDYSVRISSQGLPFESYLQMTGMTREGMLEQSKPGALHQLQGQIALDAVARAEGIAIPGEEIEAEYARLAEQFKMETERVKGLVSDKEITDDLTRRKAMEVIKASAVIGAAPDKKEPAKPKKAPAKKPAAKKTDAEKADTEKKPTEKKAPAKKAAAKPTDGEKKPAAKKTTAKAEKAEK